METDSYKQQGGCVPLRGTKENLHVMLITNKSGKHWVLPKGTIKKSEQAPQAAKRETKEECGVKGDIGTPLGLFYDHKKGYAIHFFVLHVTKEKENWREKTTRNRKWYPIDEAIATVKKKYIVEILKTLKKSNASL